MSSKQTRARKSKSANESSINRKQFARPPSERPIVQHGGLTSLHRCADRAEAEQLLEWRPDLLDAVDDAGRTPLLMAAAAAMTTVVELLLDRGADVNRRDIDGRTALHYAAATGNAELIDVLLSAGSQPLASDNLGATPLHGAVYACSVVAAETCPPPAATRLTAAEHKSYGKLEQFDESSHGRSPRTSKTSGALHDAIIVLEKMASQVEGQLNGVDSYGRTALVWAVSLGCPAACRTLLKAGADMACSDVDGITALHCAMKVKDIACAELLIGWGADTEKKDVDGCTPLFYAVDSCHVTAARLLLTAGAECDHQDHKGRSAAHFAARRGSIDCLQCLYDFGANLWLPCVTGDLPVHEAAVADFVETVSYLLCVTGVDGAVDLTNDVGRTCLHIAAMNDNLSLIYLLVKQHGASVGTRMKYKGRLATAVEIARMYNNEGCEMAIDYCRKNSYPLQLAKRTKESNSPEVRHFATQTDEALRVETPSFDEHYFDDNVTVTTDQPETSPAPSIVSCTKKSEFKRSIRKKSPLRRQRPATLFPNTGGDLIQAEVLAYEAVRAASTAIREARLQQLQSVYGVRLESREESGGVGPRSGRIRAPPPPPSAKTRELAIISNLEQTYNQKLPSAVTVDRGTSANKIDFRVQLGSSRNMNEFNVNMQGNTIIADLTAFDKLSRLLM